MAADKWTHSIFSRVEQLRSNPEVGRIVPEINERQFMALIYANYRIIYRIEAKKYPN
ncbi:MAG: type II toxin-antitoxin system RelE/ParE family toxin [Thermodesulfobacteriota bacterium]|nr:type II toxin-antitoxin system RelE/ParE family toxin [Thermodesulfobacteriota bacterium]